MTRRKTAAEPTQAELLAAQEKPAPPTWRERLAMHRLMQADMQVRRDGDGWDPLELRLGQRARNIQRRPYFAISNPLHHEVLLRNPDLDDSRPGPAWLWAVYGRPSYRTPLVLPGLLQRFRARWATEKEARRARWAPKAAPSPQAALFTENA